MKYVRNLILVFLAMSLGGSMWQLWLSIGLPLPSRYYMLIQYLSILVLLLAVQAAKMRLPAPQMTSAFRGRLGVFLVVLVMAAGVGLLSNRLLSVINDLWVYLVFFSFLLLGRYDEVWESLEKPMIAVFWICFLLVLVGLSRPMTLGAKYGGWETGSERMLEQERGAVVSVGGRLAGSLEFWPVLFALGYLRTKKDMWKAFGIAVALGYMVAAIIFQFRSRLIVVGMYSLSLLLIVPMLQRKLRIGTGILVLAATAGAIGLASGTSSFDRLMARFSQQQTWEGRFREMGMMFNDIGPIQYVIGKGMGGSYYAPGGGIGGASRGQAGESVRTELHCGFPLPILKGGLLLFAAFYAFFLSAFWVKPHGWYANRFNAVAMAVVPVYLMYLVMVPQPGIGDFLASAATGMCCARFGCVPRPQYLPLQNQMAWQPARQPAGAY